MIKTILVLVVAFATSALAQDTPTYFKQNCTSCHTIGGGRLTGPDLKDVTQRKERAWLQEFIQNPAAKISAGDPYALKLRDEARGVVMPPPPGISAERAGMLLDLIDAESKLETSHFKGVQISNAPFTPADVERGATIFRGAQPLKNGGPACMACHSAAGVGGLGGGKLGPDLMRVYERLQGRAGISAWLAAPGTVTMRAVFEKHPLAPDEIHGLVAYFEKQSQQGTQRASASQLNFMLYGLGATVLGLLIMDMAWKGRLQGVRRPLVQEQSSRGNP
jgi:cytochrome c2